MQPLEEPKLIPVTEARKIVENCEDEKSFKIWCDVVKGINRAIDDGEFSYSEDGHLPDSVIKKLRDFGYKVQTGSQYNTAYYVIKW